MARNERLLCQRRLARFSDELQDLADWYGRAADRVHSAKPGPRGKSRSLLALVHALNDTLIRATGKPISRSANRMGGPGSYSSLEFTREVCKYADSKLSNAVVDDAVKKIVQAARQDELMTILDWDVPLLIAKSE